MELTPEGFQLWKEHYMTQAVMKRLAQIESDIAIEMQDEAVICSPLGHLKLNYLAGERNSLQLFNSLTVEDLIDENSDSSRL